MKGDTSVFLGVKGFKKNGLQDTGTYYCSQVPIIPR